MNQITPPTTKKLSQERLIRNLHLSGGPERSAALSAKWRRGQRWSDFRLNEGRQGRESFSGMRTIGCKSQKRGLRPTDFQSPPSLFRGKLGSFHKIAARQEPATFCETDPNARGRDVEFPLARFKCLGTALASSINRKPSACNLRWWALASVELPSAGADEKCRAG